MVESSNKHQGEKKVSKIATFSVPFALETIKENLSIYTNNPSPPSKEQIIKEAYGFHSQGNTSEAAKYYQYFIDRGFEDHRVFCNYGVVLQNLGKLKEAEISYRKAIELKPDFAESYYNLGLILKDLEQLKKAEESYRKAIELNPNFAEAHSNLGGILKDLGNLQAAALSTRKALKLKPNYAKAYFQEGIILKLLGRYKDAIQSFNKASEIEPRNAKYYAFRGLKPSYFYREPLTKNKNLIKSINQCNWKQSKIFLEKACKDTPKDTEINVNEFIKLWCDYLRNIVDQDSPKKLLEILTNLIIIDERNKNINKLLKYVFESFDLSLLLELAEKKDKILLTLGYSQYKFQKKDFVEAQFIASNNIKQAEILIKRQETEDLGWLIVRRSLRLYKQKNIARDSLTKLINNLSH